MKKQFIFVYGTLKKFFSNHHFIENEKYIDDATTVEKYAMYPVKGNAFPFVINSESINYIRGEVYEINSSDTLKQLDYLEGYPELYLKEVVKVKLLDETILDVLMYFKNESNHIDAMDKSKPSLEEWL